MTLYITFSGDTTFKSFWRPIEWQLCAGCTSDFSITFAGVDNTVDSGRMFITDGTHAPDTIQLYAQDTGIFPWVFDSVQPFAGSAFGLPDSAWVVIRNQRDQPLDVSYEYIWNNFGFTAVGTPYRTIPAHGTTKFYIKYESAIYDTAYGRVQFYGGGKWDLVNLSAANAKPTADTLAWSRNMDFGAQKQGITECRPLKIYNHFDGTASITSLYISMNDEVFEIEDPPALPYSLQGHDSLTLSVCFSALAEEGTYKYGGIRIEYQFPGKPASGKDIALVGQTAKCIEVSPASLNFGEVHVGMPATRSLTLSNNTNAAVLIDSVVLYDFAPGFSMTGASSFSIPAQGEHSVQFIFSPIADYGDSAHYTYVGIYTHDACQILGSIYLEATPLPPIDTSAHPLFADTTQTLIFTGDSTISSQVFKFINDLDDSLKILSVSLQNATNFSISDIDPETPQFILPPDSLMSVTLNFIGPPGTYDDTLIIVTEGAMIALNYRIHADIKTSGVETTSTAAPMLRLSPNPATGPVRIALVNARSATIEVLDVMGKTVEQLSSDHWDHRNSSHGTYFVRASGYDYFGKPFVITRRLLVQ
jgi:hypothetical protein